VLRISQQQADSDYQVIGPEAIVEVVSIGSFKGEYVSGGWKIPEVESLPDGSGNSTPPQPVWDANTKLQTLRWSDGEYLYEIILAGAMGQSGYINKDGLITLANQMH
jgi:hypothetical protein